MTAAPAARILVLCVALLAVGDQASGGSRAPAGSAHEPRFGEEALWPRLTGKEYFLKERWPKARLLVWAHPGKSGSPRVRNALDPTDPANWLVDGKTPQKVVLDENTDLLLPASETRYTIGFRGTPIREVLRHVTIEAGAQFVGGGDGRGRKVYGNVWIRKGGKLYAQGATDFLGGRHTFFRNDNVLANPTGERKRDLHRCSQYFTFNKENGRSVEFLGIVTVLDEFRIYGCTVIVGRDSTLQPGRNASPTIDRGGVLALLDGATFESWNNDFGTPEIVVRDGAIQGGLPDRPLTRSCTYGLAFKNHTKAVYATASEKVRQRQLVRVPAMVVLKGALRSFTHDPSKARLVFTEMANQDICPRPGSERYQKEVGRWPEKKELFAWLMTLPRGLDCFLGKEVAVDAVEFDHFRKGGFLCQDPEARKSWTNVVFGPHCLAKGDDLFAHLEKVGRRGDY